MRGALWRGVADARFLVGVLAPGTRVWDLGCGDGKFLQGLADAGFVPAGLDFSGHALRAARKRLPCALVKADVARLPVRPASAMAIAARYVLGALDAAGRAHAAAQVSAALAPGGVLAVEEFSPHDFRFGEGREVEPATFERNRGILTHYFDRDEVPALLPTLRLLRVDEVESVQRVGARRARRHRYRWLLRSPESKDSMGAADAADK